MARESQERSRERERENRDADRGKGRDRDRDADSGRDDEREPAPADAGRGLGVVTPELMEYYKTEREKSRRRSGSAEWIQFDEEGTKLIRILPALDETKPFYYVAGQHYQLGPQGKSNVYCPKVTLGEDCPICEYVELVKEKSKKPRELEQAKDIAATQRWFCLALDRDEDDDKPRIWGFPWTIYNQLLTLLTEGKYPDLYDFERGFDISVKKTPGRGKSRRVEYQVIPERSPSAVDPGVIEKMIDVEDYINKRIFSSNELERVLNGDDPMDILRDRDGDTPTRDRARESDRDRDADRDRGRNRDDDRDRDRGRDRGRERDDDRSRSAGRDRDDDRGSDRDRGRGDDRGKDRDNDRDRGRGEDRGRAREHETDSGREPERESRGRGRGDEYDDAAASEIDRLRRQAAGKDDEKKQDVKDDKKKDEKKERTGSRR